MRIILLLIAVMLLMTGAEARYSPGLEIATGENITFDGGRIISPADISMASDGNITLDGGRLIDPAEISMASGGNITLDGGYLSGAGNLAHGVIVIKDNETGITQAFKNGELIGNGTDDFTICQIGLDALDQVNKTIDFYGYQFVGNVPLRIPDYCYMDGHGSQFIDDSDNDTVYDSIFTDKNASAIKDYHSRRISNVYVDGIDKASVDYCFNLSRTRYALIENCMAMHALKDGFLIRDDSWGIFLLNPYTYDNKVRGIHFAPGPNDAPNAAIVLGGRIMADDDHAIFIEGGQDIRLQDTDINSAGVGVYAWDDAFIADRLYMEALTYGFYLGDGSHEVNDAVITNCRMYSVSNPVVVASADSIALDGNKNDGVPIDTYYWYGTGTGSSQTINLTEENTGLIQAIVDCSVFYTESGTGTVPSYYIEQSPRMLYITATSGRDYRIAVHMGI